MLRFDQLKNGAYEFERLGTKWRFIVHGNTALAYKKDEKEIYKQFIVKTPLSLFKRLVNCKRCGEVTRNERVAL